MRSSAILNQNKTQVGRSGDGDQIVYAAIFTPRAKRASRHFNHLDVLGTPAAKFSDLDFSCTASFRVQRGHVLNANAIFQM